MFFIYKHYETFYGFNLNFNMGETYRYNFLLIILTTTVIMMSPHQTQFLSQSCSFVKSYSVTRGHTHRELTGLFSFYYVLFVWCFVCKITYGISCKCNKLIIQFPLCVNYT